MAQLEINKIYCGDCIILLQENTNIKPRLIFADPPFNIGYEYEAYHDNLEYDHYVIWTQDWMKACYNAFYRAIRFSY